jgi:hypothetical protein
VSSSAVVRQVNGRFGRVLLQVVMLDCVAFRKVVGNEIVVKIVMRKSEEERGAPKSSDIFAAKLFERGSVLPPMTL